MASLTSLLGIYHRVWQEQIHDVHLIRVLNHQALLREIYFPVKIKLPQAYILKFLLNPDHLQPLQLSP